MGGPIDIPQVSVAEYEQFEGDWELWNGVPVSMTPPAGVPHQRLGRKLLLAIERQLAQQGCTCEVLYETGWKLSERTVLVPDLMVVCEPVDGAYVEARPQLVIELLSDATAARDRIDKRRLYASAVPAGGSTGRRPGNPIRAGVAGRRRTGNRLAGRAGGLEPASGVLVEAESGRLFLSFEIDRAHASRYAGLDAESDPDPREPAGPSLS